MIDNLQFLRPDWFYAFIPLLIFIVLMFRRQSTSFSWKSVCDVELLPHVLTHARNKTSFFPLMFIFIAGSLCILAAAGPAWEKLPRPVFSEQSALVIALDLSQSMDATDIRPSRLVRARLKILDILKARQGGQTALIVYAADAFTVTPLTDDSGTIASLVSSLDTGMMPSQGSRTSAALLSAGNLLQQAGITNGEILLITDGVYDTDDAIKQLTSMGHRISILGIGTPQGSPIPMSGGFLKNNKGAIVIPKLDALHLQQTALTGNGIYVDLQADDSDINRLSKLYNSKHAGTETEETELTADIWKEEGPWLLLLVIPFAALWSRRGWLLCCAIFILPLPETGYAFEMSDLWHNQNQRAKKEFDAGKHQQAAELFKQPEWKASAYYRNGEYEKSLEILGQKENQTSTDTLYNRGNALAMLGRYPEAINAYEQALKLNSDNEDALYNLELVKKAMDNQQQNSDQQSGNDDKDQDNKNRDDKDQDDKNQSEQSQDGKQDQNQQSESEQENNSNSEQQSAENKQQEKNKGQKNKDQQNNEQHGDSKKDREPENSDAEQQSAEETMAEKTENNELTEEQYATEQWLRRIPDDPGGLLRRKFEYQYKRMPNKTRSDQPW